MMTSEILRPVFNENQIISADDVNGIVDHARDAQIRHNAYLHSWGIVNGLKLESNKVESDSGTWEEVNITAGMAIDGNGREIVVTESLRLSEDVFEQLNIEENTNGNGEIPEYPVYIIGKDESQKPSANAISSCHQSFSTRTIEGFEITFGRVGSATELNLQKQPELDQATSDSVQNNWLILLGFVQWENGHFTAIADESEGVKRRYAGVRADEVVSYSGELTLRSAQRTESDKAVVVVDNNNGGEMRFGLQDNSGSVVPVFTVNSKGDVTAEGMIRGAVAGGVQIESGTASDGTTLPLPQGITQDQIDSGEVTIQIQVRPRFQQTDILPPLGAGDYWYMTPLDCFANGRRVVCLNRWEATDATKPKLVLPGVCDYTVMAFVKAD